MRQKIAIKYGGGISIIPVSGNSEKHAMSLMSECMKYGYVFSEELFKAISSWCPESIDMFYKDVIQTIKEISGADVEYEPMYPNFPEQVMNTSHFELYLNAIMHYWSFGTWSPEYKKLPRLSGLETIDFKVLNLLPEEEFNQIFYRLVYSKESIKEADKKVIEWFLEHIFGLKIQDEIPYKENMCFLAGLAFKQGLSLDGFIKTATDVLRVVTYLNEGDISLSQNTKFKSMKRQDRKDICRILERVIKEEDIARHKNKWIRLFHNLHVGDYSKKLYRIAKKFRDNKKVQTFNGRVQEFVDDKDFISAIHLLKSRPSEFARRLDHLLRMTTNKKQIIVSEFLLIAHEVPTRILLQLWGHFQSRGIDSDSYIVFPKGKVQKGVIINTERKKLPKLIINKIENGIMKVLLNRFALLPALGPTWVDPLLKDCPIPTQQRSASDGKFNVARSTKLPIGDKGTLRMFLYWIGQDIDLSATFYDDNFNKEGHISYTNLKEKFLNSCHSGDITRAHDGAAEFIDIDIDKALKNGIRYVSMNVLVFSGPTFKEHKKCYAGWMTRDKPKSNEIFEPKTVEQKIDLTAESKNSMPVIFDLIERKAIWADMFMNKKTHYSGNNIESNAATIEETMKAIVECNNKVSLFSLFSLHGMSRGGIVADKKEAENIFSIYEGTTPFNIDIINSEYI